jgi:phospholipid/cholesterol/gamma-HCH transport system permease protein
MSVAAVAHAAHVVAVGASWPLRVAAFCMRTLWAATKGPPATDTLLLTVRLLVRSLPVVLVVTFFSGAMLTVQAAVSLQSFGASNMSGLIVGFGGVREVFPLLAGGSLAARTGAELASQLQAMRVTRQVEALEMMGLDPFRLLVAPRLIACILGGPLCVVAAMVAGLAGAHIIGVFQLGIDRGTMWGALLSAVGTIDVIVGVVKGVVLGAVVGAVATFEGSTSDETGPRSVGRAANRAVIRGMVLVCSSSLALSMLIYGRLIGGQ